MTENDAVVKDCAECACECGLVCVCTDCQCPKSTLDKETAAIVAEFSSDQREKGC